MDPSGSAAMDARRQNLPHQGLSEDRQRTLCANGERKMSKAQAIGDPSFAGRSVFLRPRMIDNLWAWRPGGLQHGEHRGFGITLNKLITIDMPALDAEDWLQTFLRNDESQTLPQAAQTGAIAHTKIADQRLSNDLFVTPGPVTNDHDGQPQPEQSGVTKGKRDEIQQRRPAA